MDLTEYYFIKKELVVEEVRIIGKNGEEITKTMSYRLKFLHSARFKTSPWSVLIILLKEFIKLNANANMMIKNLKLAGLNSKIETPYLNTQTLKIIY